MKTKSLKSLKSLWNERCELCIMADYLFYNYSEFGIYFSPYLKSFANDMFSKAVEKKYKDYCMEVGRFECTIYKNYGTLESKILEKFKYNSTSKTKFV